MFDAIKQEAKPEEVKDVSHTMSESAKSALETIDDETKNQVVEEKPDEIKDLNIFGQTEEVSEETTADETPQGEETETPAETEVDLSGIDQRYLDECEDMGVEITPKLADELRRETQDLTDEEFEQRQIPEPEPEEKIEEIKIDLDADVVGGDVKKAIDKITGELNKYRTGLAEEKKALNAERNIAHTQRIDASFDKHAKEFYAEAKKTRTQMPLDLGLSTKGLSARQKGLRREIYAHAAVTERFRRMTPEQAIRHEVDKYKNLDGEAAAEYRVVNRLKRQRITNPPTRRQPSVQRKFASDAERIEYTMEQAEQKAGLK